MYAFTLHKIGSIGKDNSVIEENRDKCHAFGKKSRHYAPLPVSINVVASGYFFDIYDLYDRVLAKWWVFLIIVYSLDRTICWLSHSVK